MTYVSQEIYKPNHPIVKHLNFTIMPIIKDPVHNQHQGQFGIVYCEHLPGGGDGLAVYDKELDSSNNVRHLPTGWRVNGPISELDTPYMW